MMKLETGRFLNGVEILLGDKLKRPNTLEVVVLFDKENNVNIVQAISRPDIICSLDEFLKWNDLEVTGSVLHRQEKLNK